MTADGQLLAQTDGEPVMGFRPTYSWLIGEEIVDPLALLLPLDILPGEYSLWAGLYDRDTLERIPLESGQDRLLVGISQGLRPIDH